MGAEPPKIRMRWREVAKDERKAERISKFSALDNRRILRRSAVFLHGVHAADPQNRRRSLSRHTPPKRIHGNKLAARAVHDRVRADSRRMADDKLSTPPVSACFTTPRCSRSSPVQRCILHFPIAKRKNSRDMQSRQPHLFSILSIVSPTHSLRYP